MSQPDLPPPETVTLRDGTPVTLRSIRPGDAPRLQALHSRLSPETRFLRFLSLHPVLTQEEAERLANVDYQSRMAIVATHEGEGEEVIIGVARYSVTSAERPEEAEPAVVVEDSYQGRGLGTLLVNRLVAYARAHGIRVFTAEISAQNDQMLRFIHRSGVPVEKHLEGGSWAIRMHIAEQV